MPEFLIMLKVVHQKALLKEMFQNLHLEYIQRARFTSKVKTKQAPNYKSVVRKDPVPVLVQVR
jgi:hypothetical protein